MNTLHEIMGQINIDGMVLLNEPMSRHTTFEVGGPADLYIRPESSSDLQRALGFLRAKHIPVTVIGGGANVVVSDAGIRGAVIDTTAVSAISIEGTTVRVESGAMISDAAELTARSGLAGLEFLYSMPGTCGGAVWMNARCYGSSIDDVLESVRYVDEHTEVRTLTAAHEEFAYKLSPFQLHDWTIIEAVFQLTPGNAEELTERMREYYEDRSVKGHFALPCAGSVFKNDRRFNAPSGKILDELGVRGMRIGGAQVSTLHANIIVNAGNARAQDIRDLTDRLREMVEAARGWTLEPEILFIGDWESHPNTSN
ncbi:MAG: UDP-N-acetylmuramate dehydrogenase [Spirochaetaceae bacterium]